MPKYSCEIRLNPMTWSVWTNNVVQAEKKAEKELFEHLMTHEDFRESLKDRGKLIIDCIRVEE